MKRGKRRTKGKGEGEKGNTHNHKDTGPDVSEPMSERV